MDDRLMQGTGNGDAWTVTDSPGLSTCDTRPSIDTPAGARLRSPTYKKNQILMGNNQQGDIDDKPEALVS